MSHNPWQSPIILKHMQNYHIHRKIYQAHDHTFNRYSSDIQNFSIDENLILLLRKIIPP